MAYKTNLVNSNTSFGSMMENGFGIVTVMNAKVYDAKDFNFANYSPYTILSGLASRPVLCELDTLKVANVTQEGPTKTITGGKYSNALVKFGKSARLEMQDALGKAKAVEALCGGIREWSATDTNKYTTGLHFGEDFQGPKIIVGESFFIDKASGKQVDVNIIFYQFLPDSIFNLTQDAEGDASVFDMNGDLLITEVLIGTDGSQEELHGVFYSIIAKSDTNPVTPTTATVKINPVDPVNNTSITPSWPTDWPSGAQTIKKGATVSLPKIQALGYKFDGYYSDSTCTTAVVSDQFTVNEDINIYAKFTANAND